MKRILVTALAASLFVVGCGGPKPAEPKAAGGKNDPRIQRAGSGGVGGATQQPSTFTTPKGTQVPGIYELKGDHWKVLSHDKGRPEGWDAPSGFRVEYDRAQKSAATQPASGPAR